MAHKSRTLLALGISLVVLDALLLCVSVVSVSWNLGIPKTYNRLAIYITGTSFYLFIGVWMAGCLLWLTATLLFEQTMPLFFKYWIIIVGCVAIPFLIGLFYFLFP